MRERSGDDESEGWLVAGLGNPGPEYERTRHNVGFRVCDELADRLGSRFKRGKHSALVAEAKDKANDQANDKATRITLVKPQTFMNESGRAVGPLARYYHVAAERIIAVYDEIDLPFGEIRMKVGGGAAGHNGVRSLIQSLSTPEFIRVRCGVGRPAGSRQAASHVLATFSKTEEKALPALIDAAADAVLLATRHGPERAQNEVNTPGFGQRDSGQVTR
ncbi:MAG: aminoacyl-tRNA hydrolase [Actinomycetota bacterium]